MELFIGNAWAMTPPPNAQAGPFDMIMGFAPLIIVIGIFYFLIFRPQQKKQQETRDMIANLKEGDHVMTVGGMYGTVHKIKDDVVTIQVAGDVLVKVNRHYIAGLKEKVEG